jgi:fibronectin type 3 domain-containing protein
LKGLPATMLAMSVSTASVSAVKRRKFGVRALVALMVVSLLWAVPSSAALQASTMSASALNSLWGAYGDAGGHWTGGDSTVSVALPDGRVAWLYSDTYLGAVNADHSRPADAPMVNNTLVVQQGNTLGQTLHGGTAAAPKALVDTGVADELFWVTDGVVDEGALKVLYNRYRKTGTGPLDVELVGTALATFALPGLTLSSVTALPLTNRIAWGTTILQDGGQTYVYGLEDVDGLKFAHVARATGGLAGSWQFWTGSAWSANEAQSSRLMSGVGGYSVDRIGDDYVLVTQDTNTMFGPSVVAHVAASPTGPFGAPRYLVDAPEPAANPAHIIYDARTHPALAADGKLLISYNVNSLRDGDNTADARIYRPRFVEFAWPLPAPDPATVPARPAGFTVEGSSDPIRLAWTPVPGATGYRVYRRDVTAGQTHFTRSPRVESQASAEVALLTDGHAYEFRVTAVNAVGESQPSDTRSITIDVVAPAAPTGLTATPNGNGEIALSWAAVTGPAQYQVYLRDLTEQQEEFATLEPDSPFGTTATARKLVHQHDYEFVVVARNGAGDSPRSAAVTARASYALPGTPGQLTATADGAGAVRLAWQAAGPDVWYWVYQRDVTAGETAFTKLEYPVTQGASFNAAGLLHEHEYEFKVSAINGGGEGVATAPVRATARYGLPGVPTALAATVNADASVTLNWTGSGAGVWYWVYLRDVTAAETEFRKLEYPVTEGTTARPGALLDGHEYEFAVSAINQGGESQRSGAIRATARYDKPGAPTGLVATANGDGSVSLEWTAPGPNLYYWVYQRDVTGGETEFRKLEYPVTDGTTARPGALLDGHEYEFAVAGINAAGDGPRSATVRVTARHDLPGVPTGLRATPGDGEVVLEWTAVPNSWYWVYYRDITAGDTQFTKAQYPVTEGPTATLGWLANGHEYEFKVSAVNAAGEGGASAVVKAKPMPPLPKVVTGLTATANDTGGVRLEWTAPGPNLYYWVYRRDVTAGESDYTKLAYPVTDGTAITVKGLTHGHVYEFTVAGTNLAGDGPTAAPVRATVHYALPSAPTNLRGQTAGDGTVNLSWDSPGEDLWFWVYQRDVTAGQTAFTKGIYPATTTSATSGALVHGHVYEFKVTAINGGGEGPASNTIQVTAQGGLPRPPTGLTAVAGNGEVRLSWTASTTPNVYYWIYYRQTAGNDGFTRLEWPATGTTATVGSLTNGTEYEFKVAATNASGDSEPSNVVKARPLPPAPTAPTGLNAIAADGKVGLGWNQNATATTYNIYLRDVTAGQTAWTKLPYSVPEWWHTVENLTNGHRYEFRVTSVNAAGESGPSNVVSSTPVPPAPQAPTGLTAVAGNGQVTLNWNASATPNVYYWVYFRPQGHTDWYYFQYPTLDTRFVATGLLNGFRYEFKVTAANLGGQSGFSNTVAATPFQPPPAAPSGLTAVAGNGQVTLNWNASATPNVYYWVYFRPQGHTDWYYFKYPTTNTRFVATGLLNGFRYEFKVTAANGGGQSGFSNTAAATPFLPLPAAPSGLSAVAGDAQVTLTWNASATSNVYYWVYFRPQGHANWYYFQYPTTNTRFVATGLANGYTYEFKVTAANQAGQSGYSNTVSARPLPPPPYVPTLSASARPGYARLSWQCTLFPGGYVYLWIEYRTSGAWRRLPLPVVHSVGLCEQSFHFDTTAFARGQRIEYRLIAERITQSVSNVAAANVMLSRPQAYWLITEPTSQGRSSFQAGSGAWSAYGFDWANNGCSNSPDYPFGYNFKPACDRHDFGYGNHRTVGLSAERYRERIDGTLLWDLSRMCGALPSGDRTTCLGIASIYYNAVRDFGDGAWADS